MQISSCIDQGMFKQVFLLPGDSLESCYEAVAKVADYWLDVLYSKAENQLIAPLLPQLVLIYLLSQKSKVFLNLPYSSPYSMLFFSAVSFYVISCLYLQYFSFVVLAFPSYSHFVLNPSSFLVFFYVNLGVYILALKNSS